MISFVHPALTLPRVRDGPASYEIITPDEAELPMLCVLLSRGLPVDTATGLVCVEMDGKTFGKGSFDSSGVQ